MTRKYLLVLLIGLNFCQPARDSYLKDVQLNFREFGFLDANTFQVKCQLALADQPEPKQNKLTEILQEAPENFDRLSNCRHDILMAFAIFKILYEKDQFDRMEKINRREGNIPITGTNPAQPNKYENMVKQLEAKENQTVITTTYADMLPGRLVYEKKEEILEFGIYRIERYNLIKIIQQRPLMIRM